MQEAAQGNIRCQGDSSHSPCPLGAPGKKPALWSATGRDIHSHFYRLWVASDPNATWEFLGVISSWFQVMVCRLFRAMPLPQSMMTYCELDPQEHSSVKFVMKLKHFLWCNCIWKWCLPKWPSCIDLNVLKGCSYCFNIRFVLFANFDSLWLSDTIWQQRSGWTLA